MPLTTNNGTSPPYHLVEVLRSLWRWRRPIVLVTAAGTLLAIIVALLLPSYFTGHTSFLAISPDQATVDGVFGTTSNRMQFYGNGDDIDRLLAIAESDELVDFIVDSFHLYRVYDIDSTQAKAPFYVRSEFLGNYDVKKTDRDAIELSIDDRDPVRAAAMARAAREKINAISIRLIQSTQGRTAAGLREEILTRESSLTELNDRLSELRSRYGIYDTQTQSESLAGRTSALDEELAIANAKIAAYRSRGGRSAQDSIAKYEINLAGLGSARTALDSQLLKLNASLGPIDNLEEERVRQNDALSRSRIRLRQFETIMGGDQRALEVIEEAQIPVAKSKPLRSLIVVVSAFFSFLVAVVGALLIDTAGKYDWRQVRE